MTHSDPMSDPYYYYEGYKTMLNWSGRPFSGYILEKIGGSMDKAKKLLDTVREAFMATEQGLDHIPSRFDALKELYRGREGRYNVTEP